MSSVMCPGPSTAAWIGKEQRHALFLQSAQQPLVPLDDRAHQVAHRKPTAHAAAAHDRKMADALAVHQRHAVGSPNASLSQKERRVDDALASTFAHAQPTFAKDLEHR